MSEKPADLGGSDLQLVRNFMHKICQLILQQRQRGPEEDRGTTISGWFDFGVQMPDDSCIAALVASLICVPEGVVELVVEVELDGAHLTGHMAGEPVLLERWTLRHSPGAPLGEHLSPPLRAQRGHPAYQQHMKTFLRSLMCLAVLMPAHRAFERHLPLMTRVSRKPSGAAFGDKIIEDHVLGPVAGPLGATTLTVVSQHGASLCLEEVTALSQAILVSDHFQGAHPRLRSFTRSDVRALPTVASMQSSLSSLLKLRDQLQAGRPRFRTT